MVGQFFRSLTAGHRADDADFERLMQVTQRQAYSVAYRLTGNHVDAEDLVQDTYVRALRFFGKYDRNMPFTNWLFRIMTNLHIDRTRKSRKFKFVSLDEGIGEESEERQVADPEASTDRTLLESTLAEPLQKALLSTNADFRMAVVLVDMEGMSYEEVADVMETSVGTVRSRIHRGRKQVRDYLQANFADEFGRYARESAAS